VSGSDAPERLPARHAAGVVANPDGGGSRPGKIELEAAITVSEVIAALHSLNVSFVRALDGSDFAWHLEHLREDFVCVLPTGRRIDKSEFLRRAREQPGAGRMACQEVDIQPLGDVALVRGVVQALGTGAPMRYTTVWQAESKSWRAVAAQFTPLTESVDIMPPRGAFARLRSRRTRRRQ
jgi:ketosteroid isomerase-like protein